MSLSQERPAPANPNATEAEQAAARKQVEASRDTRKGRKGVAAGLAASVLATVVGGGYLATRGGESSPVPERSPSASSSPNPGNAEVEPQAQEISFGISAKEVQGNPELLGQKYYEQFNSFLIAGVDAQTANADRKREVGVDQYTAELSAPVDSEFIEAMFIDEYASNPALVDYLNTTISIANTTRKVRILSFSAGTDNKQPYYRETIVDSMETSEIPLSTSTRWHEQDNRTESIAKDLLADGPDVNDFSGGETFVWMEEDGQMKISDISHYDG